VSRHGNAVDEISEFYDFMDLIDWIGFIGVFQILLAYILNVSGAVTKKNLSFILLNLIGASLACLASVLMNFGPLFYWKAFGPSHH